MCVHPSPGTQSPPRFRPGWTLAFQPPAIYPRAAVEAPSAPPPPCLPRLRAAAPAQPHPLLHVHVRPATGTGVGFPGLWRLSRGNPTVHLHKSHLHPTYTVGTCRAFNGWRQTRSCQGTPLKQTTANFYPINPLQPSPPPPARMPAPFPAPLRPRVAAAGVQEGPPIPPTPQTLWPHQTPNALPSVGLHRRTVAEPPASAPFGPAGAHAGRGAA